MGIPSSGSYQDPGLGADLLGTGGYPPTSGLAAGLLQGLSGRSPAPPYVSDDTQAADAAQMPASPWVTDENVQELGKILTSECGGGDRSCNPAEIQGIGSTVINRMIRNGTNSVADVSGGYATQDEPTPGMLDYARKLLTGQLTDNTGGATNFYSPRSMPPEGGPIPKGADVGGGLEMTPGLNCANYVPAWAVKPNFHLLTVPGVRPAHAKFYTLSGNGPVP
jgi:hypothetical protein